MKKICFVTTVSLTLRMFVLKAAEYLHLNGYDISFICDEDPDFAASLPEYVHYYPIPMKRGISLGGIAAMRKMSKIFQREKFDLVQYSTPNASLYASIAAKRAHVPVRLYCQWGMAYVGFSGLKRKIFKQIEKTVCRLSTWIEPDSFGNLRFSHNEGLYPPEKGSVVWNGSACGIDLDKFDYTQKAAWRNTIREKYNIPEDAVVFGFVGRVTRDKGINELFAASKRLFSVNENAYLMVVGNNEITSAVNTELYHWAKNEPHVFFCGSTNYVEQYLSAMDVYILPSYREGFGMVVVEAEAMGVPVIITDIPGPTDAMIPNVTGITVQKGDDDTLYRAMHILMGDQKLRLDMGANGRSFATERFDQRILLKELLLDREKLLSCK